MAENKDFSHLPLPFVFTGKPKLHGGGKSSEQTTHNRNNRVSHGEYLKRRSSELSFFWKERRIKREEDHLPKIKAGIPLLLEIDPESDIEFLRGLGFEIICELEDGFIIVASEDIALSRFNEKADKFIENISKRCNAPARVYALCDDKDRIKRLLSENLYNKWDKILPESFYVIDLGISCCGNITLPTRPQILDKETDEEYAVREEEWKQNFKEAYGKWDEIKRQREEELDSFISAYNGEIMEMVDGTPEKSDLPDSFSARLKITGTCLIDLVMNFPYIFEATEAEDIKLDTISPNYVDFTEKVNILSPLDSAPVVCVIDSGIQEEHIYLSPAIVVSDSCSLIPNDSSISDEVNGGGHGTRVAGAVLYPNTIPVDGDYELPCWVRNLRVLDKNNILPKELFPPKILSKAVEMYSKENTVTTKIFNHSIGGRKPCQMKHMTSWAAEIDSLSYNNDVLFIQAAGNVDRNVIRAYWQAGYTYPAYLERELCRISDPAQSLQALTVGSVSNSDFNTEDIVALGQIDKVSPFSRSGPGIWDVIKPEVVEYGGTYAYNKGSNPPILTTPPEVCPKLIRKSPEGPAYAKDDVGTSFAAPKVTYIASQVEKILPKSPSLLYRALIAQSAHWPKREYPYSKEESVSLLRHIGYGIPNAHRATSNDEYRITLITSSLMEIGENEAHVFKIPIPEELSSVGEDYDVLIEITLSYAANPRRTRRSVKSYLSTWLDWRCSRIGETAENFSKRIFETGSIVDDDGDFNWVLGDQKNHGLADGFSRSNGTLQKDWCVIKSNQLSDAFCIAVRGHKGWGGLFKAKYSLAVSFEAINQDIAIYEPIRAEIENIIENDEIELEMRAPN